MLQWSHMLVGNRCTGVTRCKAKKALHVSCFGVPLHVATLIAVFHVLVHSMSCIVLAGLRGKENVEVFILHPHKRVAPIQEAQVRLRCPLFSTSFLLAGNFCLKFVTASIED